MPLASNIDIPSTCAKYFKTVELHPSGNGNPYDIYVLATRAGTEIEAVFQPGSLCLDVGSSDLHDTTLGDALFAITRDGPCAILSDESEIVVVADEKHIDTAAQLLEIDAECVEPVVSGPDLIDALFGFEAPRAASLDLAASLRSTGFEIDAKDNHKATLRLSDGLFLEIDPDEHLGWEGTEGISLGLANPRFAKIMASWPDKTTGALLQLDARKFRQDTAGFILWSGHLPFRQFPATFETPVLGAYDKTLSLRDLVDRLTKPTSPKAFVSDIFGGTLEPFVMSTEGLWVFLFLMAEAESDRTEILDAYQQLKSNGAAFGTTRDLSLDIIDAYLELHKAQLGGAG